jgi:site-specific DNA-methyltransferase (adenine-specific)
MKTNVIFNEDCLIGLQKLPDNSIDCCISSPPYWGLRDYGVDGQIGNENEFTDFINKLAEIYKEVYRVLKPEGTCFVNLGDTYMGGTAGSGGNCGRHIESGTNKYAKSTRFKNGVKKNGLPKKSLALIPERFAIEMISNGWILRNQIIWHKPNQMPSSATDRFTVDFEKIFFFVKQSTGYYFEQQLEPYTKPMNRCNGKSDWDNGTRQSTYRNRNMRPNPDGKNMRTVWSVNTKPFPGAHFAVFPETLVERMIKSGCPENGVVLDPFMGAGTTAVVARKLNRSYIGYELNPEYVKMANDRLYKELGMWL